MSTRDEFYVPESWTNRPVRIALIGAGGTGSEVLDGLARLHGALLGLGHPGGFDLTVFDPDAVSQTNVLRQRFWSQDIGQNKAVIQVHRLNMMLGTAWAGVPTAAPLGELGQFDLLITCVDKASVRSAIHRALAAENRPLYSKGPGALWLDTGNAASNGQIVLGDLSSSDARSHETAGGHRLPNVMDLYPEIAQMNDDDAPSCSAHEALTSQEFGVNRLVADVATNLLWQLLRHGRIDHHGAYVRLNPMTVSPLPIDPVGWAGLGYESKKRRSAA